MQTSFPQTGHLATTITNVPFVRPEAEIGLVVLVQTAFTLTRLRKNDVNPRENAA